MTKLTIQFQMPRYSDFTKPIGPLSDHNAAQGLFHYFLLAMKARKETEEDVFVLEGEPDPTANYKQLFQSIATAYGVQPEEMAKYWKEVDHVCWLMAWPRLPNEEKYRFDKPASIRSQ